MTDKSLVIVEDIAEGVRRITLNRPEKRNALSNALRGAIFEALETADRDASVRVTILRGAGSCFSSGYDLSRSGTHHEDMPFHTAAGLGVWPRHVTDGCFRMWDLAKPILGQVHGWCLAGGSELATGCDLVYVAEDARIGYPPVRQLAMPDNQFHPWLCGMRPAMEMLLTGDAVDGVEAVRLGFANRAFPAERLDEEVLAIANRITMIPAELTQLAKRAVHRAMDVMGIRASIRAGTEICALSLATEASIQHRAALRNNVTAALNARDAKFGDYRATSLTGS